MVSNPAPCLPARTGSAPEYRACWEELPTEEEMVQVTLLVDEIAGLSAQGRTGAVVALSFSKRLVQPIQDRVHPGFEYWGHQDPTRGQNRKVPREEASNRVTCMMQGAIRDKGCPKAHCLKRPTRAVSILRLSVLLCFCSELFCFHPAFRRQRTRWAVMNLECLLACRPKFRSSGLPLPC